MDAEPVQEVQGYPQRLQLQRRLYEVHKLSPLKIIFKAEDLI